MNRHAFLKTTQPKHISNTTRTPQFAIGISRRLARLRISTTAESGPCSSLSRLLVLARNHVIHFSDAILFLGYRFRYVIV